MMVRPFGNLILLLTTISCSEAPKADKPRENGQHIHGHARERYDHPPESSFKSPRQSPLSTFSVDVDTASYTNIRRMIRQGKRPPAEAVRIEEMINYFEYNYAQPEDDHPIAVHLQWADAPWLPAHRLLKIGLQGREMKLGERPPASLTFLVDVSGSMATRLPLLKTGLKMLAEELREEDRIAIVTYAGSAHMALASTSDRDSIMAAIDRLRSGGGTNGAAGIDLAYRSAEAQKIEGGINRVVLATDGDFNIGPSSDSELLDLVKQKAEGGIELSILGFGHGNLNDAMMERVSNEGNGNYYYIDSEAEARKVLVSEVSGTLHTIAKDVKVQIEFNPAQVSSYRLIGYENRALDSRDFNDDSQDAGEVGSGHTVTALYEIIPATEQSIEGVTGVIVDTAKVDSLVYLDGEGLTEKGRTSGETMTIKVRYKDPQQIESKLITQVGVDDKSSMADATEDMKFCTAVAGFGMLLKKSKHLGHATAESILSLAHQGVGIDLKGRRTELAELVASYKGLGR